GLWTALPGGRAARAVHGIMGAMETTASAHPHPTDSPSSFPSAVQSAVQSAVESAVESAPDRAALRSRADELLTGLAGHGAVLREDQWTAIEALVADRRRALVVQRT